ncbi:phosphatase PAP2 family protein [Roseibium aestuarii]|uniref:Phosphatase PAP2 family protein n=1 Tax=Roseibium aestuarii TaxID=2600299 RepID=A0ABW4K1K7_9HYPH|nr:phosphatase PAP2 family protein [Roseibium aestuarii]
MENGARSILTSVFARLRTRADRLRPHGHRLLAWCRRHPLTAVAIYVVLVSALFLAFPDVDLWASGLFFDPERHGFFAQFSPFLRQFRHLGPHLVTLIAIVCVGVVLAKLIFPARRPLMPLRTPLFLLTSLILGPGLLVNAILKNNWGRPRPVMVDLFDGDMPYQPVWKITSWCDTNCSFVSGEASAGMWLVAAVVLVAPVTWRKALLAFFLPLGLLLSLNRIAFGGHFLSDTLISWGLTLMVVLACHRLFFGRAGHALHDRRLDEVLTRSGRRLHVAARRAGARVVRSARRFVSMFREP